MKKKKYPRSKLFEKLAEIEHTRWAEWQKCVHSRCTQGTMPGSLEISGRDVENWTRQINTPYSDLSEKEKDSDRDQVMRYYHLIVARNGDRPKQKPPLIETIL